jgi:ribosomal silencing factor RsfS
VKLDVQILKLDQAIKSANKMESIVTEVQKQAQELGINPNNIKELQSAKLAIQEAREYKQVQSIIKKFITTFNKLKMQNN